MRSPFTLKKGKLFIFRSLLCLCDFVIEWFYCWKKLLHVFFGFELKSESWDRAMAEASHEEDRDENGNEMNMEETVEVRPLTWAFMPHTQSFPMCNHSDDANLLILPKRIYIFIRLYTLVFERLCHAQELCGRDRGLHSRPINPKRKVADHKQFYDHLYTLINGEMQEEEFERYLHKLLGPHCYNLVTMKSLLKSVERQLLLLFSQNESTVMAKTVRLFLAHGRWEKLHPRPKKRPLNAAEIALIAARKRREEARQKEEEEKKRKLKEKKERKKKREAKKKAAAKKEREAKRGSKKKKATKKSSSKKKAGKKPVKKKAEEPPPEPPETKEQFLRRKMAELKKMEEERKRFEEAAERERKIRFEIEEAERVNRFWERRDKARAAMERGERENDWVGLGSL